MRKRENEEIVDRVAELENSVERLQSELKLGEAIRSDGQSLLSKRVNKIERILKYSIPGQITYRNKHESFNSISSNSYRLEPEYFTVYIYKDMDEYEVKGLKLHNPKSMESVNKNNVIRVIDEDEDGNELYVREYLIDLNKKTFILVSEEEKSLIK